MVRPEVERYKQQFLRMSTAKLLKLIKEKFERNHNKELEADMLEGLHAAVSERPAIATAICPGLIQEPRLVSVFLDLLGDLWKQDEDLMVRLLEEVERIKDPAIRENVQEMLDLYKTDDFPETPVPGFAQFLKDHQF